MNSFARLIHKSYMTYLPTKMPVQFYGLPDGKVYLLYAKFFRVGYEKSGLEYIIAEHEEFTYDYGDNQLIRHDSAIKTKVYPETVDKPNPKIKIIKVFRSIKSFAEAFDHLNKKAEEMLKNKVAEKRIEVVDSNTRIDRKIASA